MSPLMAKSKKKMLVLTTFVVSFNFLIANLTDTLVKPFIEPKAKLV